MASTAVQTDGHRPPDLSSADRQALQDLWKVYGAQYDEITEESKAALANDPEFGPLMQSIPEEVLEQQGRRSQELLRGALLEGDWDPYLADLLEQGAGYARMGLSFVSWIAKAHGGTVDVWSEPDKGSRFTVSLPASIVEPAPDTMAQQVSGAPSAV